MKIELQIFSGRPDPTWRLTEKESREFLAMLNALDEPAGHEAMPDGLGYRGFLVINDGNDMADYDQIQIYRSIVIIRKSGKNEILRDRQMKLEKLLVESAGRHIEKSLWVSIKPEVEKGI